MKKRMLIVLISVGVVFGGILAFKVFVGFMLKQYMATLQNPIVTVSTMKAGYALWQPQVKATGSLRAVRGVSVTSEITGLIQKIYFTPGSMAKEGQALVQLNADSDIAQLHALQASADLAKTVYIRDKAQFAFKGVSKATLDADAADLKNKLAQAAAQAATVAKKTITAPFSGRLGISSVNPGQYINPGDKVVSLQTLDPIYVDFFVPQQTLVQLAIDQVVNINVDAYPNRIFTGKVTTIDPLVDASTRNVEVEATINNPKLELVPGMFSTVTVHTGAAQRRLTLPQTAVSFNPYGEIIYIVKATGKDKKDKPILTAHQSFVTTGEVRGDQIEILKGIKEGDVVVTSGQLKLKNGSLVTINNSIQPANNPDPKPVDE